MYFLKRIRNHETILNFRSLLYFWKFMAFHWSFVGGLLLLAAFRRALAKKPVLLVLCTIKSYSNWSAFLLHLILVAYFLEQNPVELPTGSPSRRIMLVMVVAWCFYNFLYQTTPELASGFWQRRPSENSHGPTSSHAPSCPVRPQATNSSSFPAVP